MMTQMSVRAETERFGEKGNEQSLNELDQLHIHKALFPIRREEMSHKKFISAKL